MFGTSGPSGPRLESPNGKAMTSEEGQISPEDEHQTPVTVALADPVTEGQPDQDPREEPLEQVPVPSLSTSTSSSDAHWPNTMPLPRR